MKKRTLEIKCVGAAVAKLEDLTPLQGKLKKLDNDRYRKLKRALLEHGFSFPFFVWKNDGELFILDGHQRDRVLRRLQASGYIIPPLPIAYIQAANLHEAREKILLLTSQYGEMTDESFMQFVEMGDLDLDDLAEKVDLSQVDIEKLLERYDPDGDEEAGNQEMSHQFQVIVDCKDEDQQLQLIEKLEKQKYICRALIL